MIGNELNSILRVRKDPARSITQRQNPFGLTTGTRREKAPSYDGLNNQPHCITRYCLTGA